MRRLAPLLLFALSACTLAPATRGGNGAPPVPPLAGAAALPTAHGAMQVVRGAFGERELSMFCAVTAGGRETRVIGVSTLGQRLFSLRHDGERILSETSTLVPAAFSPERLLGDLELALWPLPALQAAYAGSAWSVSEPTPATRRLLRDGKLVAEVHYTGADPWSSRYWISNFEFGYTLAVEPQAPES